MPTCGTPRSARALGRQLRRDDRVDDEDSSQTRRVRTNFPGLKEITATNYPGFDLAIADTTRARLFADSVASWDRQGRFPDLVILWLPRDHTLGRVASRPTPRAMVAENDLALGQIVERLTHCAAWPSARSLS